MPEMETRKCNCCKKTIEIYKNNIVDIVLYKKLYYHKSCFCTLATKRSQSKKGKPEEWKGALNNVFSLENDAKQTLKNYFAKDDLNEWLLEHYDITTVPKTFWQMVADLENGIYKKKRCKPVDTETLCNAWKWGQRKLNDIALRNKTKNMGPKNDSDRISYDFAILLKHISDYKKYLAKISELESERLQRKKENIQIDYNKIKANNTNSDALDDISDLLDDLI